MDELDRKILNLLQTEFPVASEPFRIVGERLGLSGEEVVARVRRLRERGIIRRIGATFDPRRLGYASTLCAAKVPEDLVGRFVETVNACPGVTHNYRRDHAYNIWFTLIAESEEALERTLAEIAAKTGVRDILSMKAARTFKIDASFKL
jgi:DNA-binding Lrp family transcriptional regulator